MNMRRREFVLAASGLLVYHASAVAQKQGRVARTLDLKVPQSVLVRADRVIE